MDGQRAFMKKTSIAVGRFTHPRSRLDSHLRWNIGCDGMMAYIGGYSITGFHGMLRMVSLSDTLAHVLMSLNAEKRRRRSKRWHCSLFKTPHRSCGSMGTASFCLKIPQRTNHSEIPL